MFRLALHILAPNSEPVQSRLATGPTRKMEPIDFCIIKRETLSSNLTLIVIYPLKDAERSTKKVTPHYQIYLEDIY